MENLQKLIGHLRSHSLDSAVGDPETSVLENDAANVLERLHSFGTMNDEALRLRCGEMTAQEIRTVRAVLNSISAEAYSNFA